MEAPPRVEPKTPVRGRRGVLGTRTAVGLASVLLVVGGIASALSRWYLVWLAQELGGAEGLGAYGLLFAVATPIFVAAQMGLRTVFVSKGIAYPWRSYLILRATGLVGGTITLGLFVLLSPVVTLMLGAAVLLLKIFDILIDLYMARIQYAGRIQTMALLWIASAVLSMVFSTVAAVTFQSLPAAVGGAVFASILTAAVTSRIARAAPYVPDITEPGYRELLGSSLAVTVAELLSVVLLYLPVWLLGFTAELVVVGLFTGVAYVLTAADIAGSGIAETLITPLRRLTRSDGSRAVIRAVNQVTAGLAVAGVLAGVLFVLVGSSLFQWIYGPEFELSPTVLALFALGAIFVVLSHVQSVCLKVLNFYSHVATAFVMACLVALVVGVVLTLLKVDALVVGSAMVAAGSAGRTVIMFFGVRFAQVRAQ